MSGTTTVTLQMAGLDREDLRLLRSALKDKCAQVAERLQRLADRFPLDSQADELEPAEEQARRLTLMLDAANGAYTGFPVKLEATLTVERS